MTPFTPPGATRNSEKRIVLLIVNLQFSKLSENGFIGVFVVHLHLSDLVIWPNLDIPRSESLPKLNTSFSPTDSVKQKSRILQPVRRSEKNGVLTFYRENIQSNASSIYSLIRAASCKSMKSVWGSLLNYTQKCLLHKIGHRHIVMK